MGPDVGDVDDGAMCPPPSRPPSLMAAHATAFELESADADAPEPEKKSLSVE